MKIIWNGNLKTLKTFYCYDKRRIWYFFKKVTYLCMKKIYLVGSTLFHCEKFLEFNLLTRQRHTKFFKVHTFWEGRKILRNLHLTTVYTVVKSKVKIWQNFCGLLRIYELYPWTQKILYFTFSVTLLQTKNQIPRERKNSVNSWLKKVGMKIFWNAK